MRRGGLALATGVSAAILVVAALYLARAVFVPLFIGILASYALTPVVDLLKRWRIPRALGAGLVLLVLVAMAGWGLIAKADDAASVIELLPQAARKIRQHVQDARAQGPGPLQKIQEAATELQGAAADAAGEKKVASRHVAPTGALATEQSAWLRDYLLAQSAMLFSVLVQAPLVLLLTYFLLASGEHFRRKLVQFVGPTFSRQREAVRVLEEIDTQIQRYLLATLAANVLVGVLTWLAFAALGLEQAGVWGATAGILHFIPYLGPMLFAVLSGMAGFMQFDTALSALTVAGVSVIVSAFVGSFIMTWAQSRFASVNAAVLFIALLFFGWLWGIWGLLLGAPILAIIKVICDRVDNLKAVGELIGH
ncbi:MAG TPA: AI-2E family transporter [Usitatibacteraceae bacterium]|nr:AI-2E family transporter [Usitatibacteraceae bacterium]